MGCQGSSAWPCHAGSFKWTRGLKKNSGSGWKRDDGGLWEELGEGELGGFHQSTYAL